MRLPVDAFKGTSHDAGQRLGGGYAGLCLGDPDIGELTISEMSPEDIRAELKRWAPLIEPDYVHVSLPFRSVPPDCRLYTQLEILKNKTLRQDNPHISKRRGGRKAGHRRFSLQVSDWRSTGRQVSVFTVKYIYIKAQSSQWNEQSSYLQSKAKSCLDVFKTQKPNFPSPSPLSKPKLSHFQSISLFFSFSLSLSLKLHFHL